MSAAHGHRGGGKSKGGGANPGGARGTGPLPLQKKKKNKKKGMKENRIHDLNKKKKSKLGEKRGGGCMGE